MTKANDPVISRDWIDPGTIPDSLPTKELLVAIQAKPLTKRELFAAMAMQGILVAKFREMVANVPVNIRYELLGKDSLFCADALIKELNKVEELKP